MARLVVGNRPAPVFPEVEREVLLAAFQQTPQGHPRLKSIHRGNAIFESGFTFQYTLRSKISYHVTCTVPLTDPVFQKERNIEWLYYSEAAPYMRFRPDSYTDNRGYDLS